jgi:hypothetical protein
MERKRTSERYSLSRKHRGRVRSSTERKRAKDTHYLESTEGGTSHDTKRKCMSEFLTSLRVRGDGQVRARKGKEPNEREALTSWSVQRKGQVRKQQASKPRALTFWGAQREGQVGIRKKNE